jgi:hypothetical protein
VLTLERGSRFDCAPTKRVLGIDVIGGQVILRGNRRHVQITDDVAVVRLEKAAGQLLPLVLETRAHPGLAKGSEYEVSVAQRDEDHQVVGGASVMFVGV